MWVGLKEFAADACPEAAEALGEIRSCTADFAGGIINSFKTTMGASVPDQYEFEDGRARRKGDVQLNGCLEHLLRGSLEPGHTGMDKLQGTQKSVVASLLHRRWDFASRRF